MLNFLTSRQRTRECNSPVPSHGGKTCQGEKRQENKCPQAACPTRATIPTLDSICGTRIPGTSQQVKGRCPDIPLPFFSSYFKGLYKELIFDRSHEMIDISLSLVGLKSKEK